MHGKAVQLGRGASRMLRSSPMVGTRQSQCPAKQSVAVPSLGVFRSFSLSRKSEYSVPVGSVKGVAALHVYVLFTSCGSGHSAPQTTTAPGVPVFFSHISPVWLSQTVRSPMSVKRVGGFAGHATAAPPPAAGVPPPPPPPSPQAVSASRIDRLIIDATILRCFMFSDVSWSFPHSLGAAGRARPVRTVPVQRCLSSATVRYVLRFGRAAIPVTFLSQPATGCRPSR